MNFTVSDGSSHSAYSVLDPRSWANPKSFARALGQSCGTVPVLGRHLESIGTVAAIGAWGSRLAPRIVRALTEPQPARPPSDAPAQAAPSIVESCENSLVDIVGDVESVAWPQPRRFAPIFQMKEQRHRFLYRRAVKYGPAEGQLLDVWRRPDLPAEPAPVMIFVPGGAWVHGSRSFQGHALMAHLAAAGWVCLAIDYRVSPRHRWPRHVMDVKAAVAWARANADQFGGDRAYVAIAGCSAGGHLASLAGLTAGDPEFEAELPPDADTSVDAVVSIYGRYDWDDRSTQERDGFVDFLEHIVMQRDYQRHRESYRAASPILRITEGAPPFFVVHGTADIVIPVAQARSFVEVLRQRSHTPVGYLEVPGAQHAFDLIDGSRTGPACTAIGLFLDEMHHRHILTPTASVG